MGEKRIKKDIKNLLNFPTISSSELDLYEIILVYLEEKPATYFSITSSSVLQIIKDVLSVFQLFKKVGLLYNIKGIKFDLFGDHILGICTAKTKENLRRIKKAKTAEELGYAYGFPETAIKAFCGYDGYTRMELWEKPDELKNSKYAPLRQFVSSKENWPEELKTVARWYYALEKYVPEILEERIENYRLVSLNTISKDGVTNVSEQIKERRRLALKKEAER